MAKFAVALGVVGALGDDRAKYAEFQAKFGSNGGEEEFQVFASNLRTIEQLQESDPTAMYSHLSPFAAIAPEEFMKRNGYQPNVHAVQGPLLDVSSVSASYDARDHGYVNAIKDQGQCGSCWAFSTVANVEGAGAKETGKLLSLSEQQLVDCDTTNDSGCNGGLPSNAFQYMIDNGVGLQSESAYPYTASDKSCHASKSQEKAFITAWHQISTDETQIAAALQQYGPLSIGINAANFQFYSGGVSSPFLCNPRALDHGVAIVAFGTDSGTDYWTIRNSWGTSWGEDGYIRIARGKGTCGLNTDVTTATGISTQMLAEEPRQFAKGFVRQARNGPVAVARITEDMRSAAPSALDLATTGATSPVKDQGSCGSCWAFSATEGVESAVYQQHGVMPILATQQLVACDPNDGGCNGGDLPTAFDYLEKSGGMDSAADYKDTSSRFGFSGRCKASDYSPTVKVTGSAYAVPPCEGGSCSNQDESGLMAALNTFGPLSVCVNANTWNEYGTGIYTASCSGSYNSLDHCVQLVGYDSTGSAPYWKVKNSWTTGWGEGGFIRLPMGNNACGIADEAMYVTAELINADVSV